MVDLQQQLAGMFVPLTANIGMLSLAAWGVSCLRLRKSDVTDLGYSLDQEMIGLLLGVTAALLMFLPIEIQPGLFADGRGAPILLAGVVGGPYGATIAAIITAMFRIPMGGTGLLPGVAYIFICGAAGVAWGWWARTQGMRPLRYRSLILLALLATVGSMLTLLLLPSTLILPVLFGLYPVFLISNLVGVIILGRLLERDERRFEFEQDLYQQRIAAEASAAAKSRFLSTMSHEVKTPLNAVIGFSDLIRQDAFGRGIDEEYKTFAENIHESGQRLLALLDDAIELSELDDGSKEMDLQPVPVSEIWSLPFATLWNKALAGDVTLELLPTDDQLAVRADFRAAQRIVFSILSNAIKFTQPGGKVICRAVRNGDSVQLKVRDNGCGMDPSDIPRLTGPFEQADDLFSERRSGTGIGLAIVTRLVKRLNGDLRIESWPGKGTEVTVTLRAVGRGQWAEVNQPETMPRLQVA